MNTRQAEVNMLSFWELCFEPRQVKNILIFNTLPILQNNYNDQ